MIASPAVRQPVHVPDPAVADASQLAGFMRFCARETGRAFADQAAFHSFSVDAFRDFWLLFLRWSGVVYEGEPDPVCTDDRCEEAAWFPDLRLSYAENLLRPGASDAAPAVVALHDARGPERLDRRALRERVVALALALRDRGVEPGDRVVAVLHNDSAAVIAGLATTALGAVFSTAPPDMGSAGILSRFEQLAPSVLIADLEDAGAAAPVALAERVSAVVDGLPTLQAVIAAGAGALPRAGAAPPLLRLSELVEPRAGQSFDWPRFPFGHPLFILFSSGTTGRPKCIVHGAGGTLLEHLKEHRLHNDFGAGDRLLFHTSTGWMMWHWQLSALACETEIVLFDGALTGPETLWRLVSDERVTAFGTSPPYLRLCEESGFLPRRELPLDALRVVMSTGSILHDQQYDWVREHVGDLPVQSISGGTDILGCFVLGSPLLPVYRGESQCQSLGLDVQALGDADEQGKVTVGELICRNPFPSRPLGFYGDEEGRRFHDAYFAANPGVWTHGDVIAIAADGSGRMLGRSDGVLNVGGVRIGPAEIYSVLQRVSELRESMAVERAARDERDHARIVLLLVLREAGSLDEPLRRRIRGLLARELGPAYVPAVMVEVAELPTTHSNKRSERAARDAVNGMPVDNEAALRNPESLNAIRTAVQTAEPDGDALDPTTDPLERLLTEIWQELLGFDAIRLDDNFFEIGGTSLLAVRLAQEIDRRLAHPLTVPRIYDAPTIARLAVLLRSGDAVSPALHHEVPPPARPAWQRRVIRRLGILMAVPMIGAYRAGLIEYSSGGQVLAMLPSRLGALVRQGWYTATLGHCGDNLFVDYGSVIHRSDSRIGDNCAVGPYCWIGWVDIGHDTMVASHVVMLSGGRMHGTADLSRPMREQPGTFERVTIGSDVWIGARATILSDVADHAIVTPGSTVSTPVAPYAVVTGVPARQTSSRLPSPPNGGG